MVASYAPCCGRWIVRRDLCSKTAVSQAPLVILDVGSMVISNAGQLSFPMLFPFMCRVKCSTVKLALVSAVKSVLSFDIRLVVQ
jgi:hypothetical protein